MGSSQWKAQLLQHLGRSDEDNTTETVSQEDNVISNICAENDNRYGTDDHYITMATNTGGGGGSSFTISGSVHPPEPTENSLSYSDALRMNCLPTLYTVCICCEC